ncbi:MAG: hypothetical protein AAB972_00445 [Patescibacteria group bacterium]
MLGHQAHVTGDFLLGKHLFQGDPPKVARCAVAVTGCYPFLYFSAAGYRGETGASLTALSHETIFCGVGGLS